MGFSDYQAMWLKSLDMSPGVPHGVPDIHRGKWFSVQDTGQVSCG